MAAEVDVQSLLWALSILAVPLLAAIPLRFIWQYWIGVGHEETEYRTTVRQIIDSGRQLESYRNSLNDVARSLRLPPSRQRLIEADILNPLSISHFLILPALIIFPLAFIVALPVMIVGLPVILVVEFILIRQRILIRIMSFIERSMHWQIIHIPQAHRGILNVNEIILNFRNTSNISTRFQEVSFWDCLLTLSYIGSSS